MDARATDPEQGLSKREVERRRKAFGENKLPEQKRETAIQTFLRQFKDLAALSESRFAPEIRRDLGDGVNQNCGPPYVLSPYRVVSVDPVPEVSKMPAPGLPSEPPIGVPDVPAPPPSLEPSRGMPEMPTPAQPPEPASDSPAPMTEEFPEPTAGGPIELFKK